MREKLMKKENMVVLVLLGILLLVVAVPFETKKDGEEEIYDKKKESITEKETAVGEGYDELTEYCLMLEERIESLLSCMDGVGAVQAMVTVSASGERIVEKDEPITRNTMTETDGNGGTRSTNDSNFEYETIYETDADGNTVPYVVKQIEPQIKGITVIAQGGGNAVVQKNISDVLESLFHIEPHRIKVAKMK